MEDPTPSDAITPSASTRWLARIMSWLCWVGIAGTAAFALANLFDAIPRDWIVREETSTTLIGSSIEIADPSAPNAAADLRHDLLYRITALIPVGLFVWALLSARASFVGVGRGEYFTRRTILGLRNFALAVLLHMTLAPMAMAIARGVYVSRFEHGAYTLTFGLNSSIMLMLVFTGVVALVSTVMAHAAKIAEENRQFV